MKLAWKLLVGLGVLLVFISLGMDTTVSTGMGRVHNIGLQGRQQMFLILGCFLFLGGIVLFGVFKIKQTPEQEAAEDEVREKARKAAEDVARERAHKAAQDIADDRRATLKAKLRKTTVADAKPGPDLDEVWRRVTQGVRWPRVIGVGIVILLSAIVLSVLSGCSYFESMEEKQLNACVKDIKETLNDPNSFELLSSKHLKMEKGHRVLVDYTAKNKLGGRVRRDEACGFVSATSVEFDPKDFVNFPRLLARATGRR